MFDTSNSHLYSGQALPAVHALRLESARVEMTKRETPGPAAASGSREARPLPHEVGLLRSTSDIRLLEAVAYIHRHLEDPIGVQELVSHVGVSRRWLEYAFRDALGETPYQYIRRQRLEHAGRLLQEEPNSRIYQIALRTGFNSAKQLTMAFRQHFGVSPRDYRRRMCG